MEVSLVIPGRNVSGTIKSCIESVVPMIGKKGLKEIVFVDDGSIDSTADIVRNYPIRYIWQKTKGPGAARNTGWKATKSELVWFLDADCIAEPDTLSILLGYINDTQIVGIGGSYGNANESSLLACLIHEEIVERHRRMPFIVNFLATFNVLYRRDVLERVDGFDEKYLKAQDAELAYRIRQIGGKLAFEPRSLVKHHHPVKLSSYLSTQFYQAYWRMHLYTRHPEKMIGDSYSSLVDHIQPVLAMMVIGTIPFYLFAPMTGLILLTSTLLLITQLPMTLRLVKQCGAVYLLFAPMGFIRSFTRGGGMISGLFSIFLDRFKKTTDVKKC